MNWFTLGRDFRRHFETGAGGVSDLSERAGGADGNTGVSAERAGTGGDAYIDSGIEPGNAPLTIHGGWIRNFVSKRPVHVEGKGFDKLMYATGELYGAFSFEIKNRGRT